MMRIVRPLVVLLPFFISTAAQCKTRTQKAPPLPIMQTVAAQPLAAQITRVVQALSQLGAPLPSQTIESLRHAARMTDSVAAVREAQAILDPYCLLAVSINPESRVRIAQGPASAELVQGDWRLFLVKVYNQAGVTAPLHLGSPNQVKEGSKPDRDNWMDIKLYQYDTWVNYGPDLEPRAAAPQKLTGLEVEYRVVQVFSREAGRRQAKIVADVGQGTQDLGLRSETDVLFNAAPTREVTFRIQDEAGKSSASTMAMFTVRDAAGRTYPSQVGRLAPDFFFHPQIYRARDANCT